MYSQKGLTRLDQQWKEKENESFDTLWNEFGLHIGRESVMDEHIASRYLDSEERIRLTTNTLGNMYGSHIDRLITKLALFSSYNKKISRCEVARIYLDEIIPRNGIHGDDQLRRDRMILPFGIGMARPAERVREAIDLSTALGGISSEWKKDRMILTWSFEDSYAQEKGGAADSRSKGVWIKETSLKREAYCSFSGREGKLAPRYVRPFEILERIGLVAYRLRLPEELSSVHDTFHVSNLKKCLADANLHVPLDEIKVDKTLCFVEEPVEIMDREIRKFKCRKVVLVKVRWNSKRGPEFTWEHEDQMRIKYP
ncbi:hypothetical protein Tco_0407948 [Tanacetum coccineum]